MSEIVPIHSVESIDSESKWKLNSLDIEDMKEPNKSEDRVNQQIVGNIVDGNFSDITVDTDSDKDSELKKIKHRVSQHLAFNSSILSYSNITCSTDHVSGRDRDSLKEQVVYSNVRKDEGRIMVEKLIDKNDSKRVESNYKAMEENRIVVENLFNTTEIEDNVISSKKDIRNNSHVSMDSILKLDDKSEDKWASREMYTNESRSVNSMNSMSSMEEEIRWLFEPDNQDGRLEDASQNESLVVSRIEEDSSISKDNNDIVEEHITRDGSKSRRREFWQKWKNTIRNKNRMQYKKHEENILKEGMQQRNIDSVFDFYSKCLDRIEIELLSKGSTFCIANNRLEEDKFKADIYAYSRRLRLHDEYREHSADSDYSQIFSQILREQRDSHDSSNYSPSSNKPKIDKGRKLPSTYDPDSQNRNLARYCSCIQEESVLAINTKVVFKDNITKEHRKALNMLKSKVEDKEVVITLADKGSGIVVVDYDKYIQKGTKYIEEEAQAYSLTQKSSKEIIKDIVTQRNKIVKKLREYEVIEVDTATYCMKQLEEKVTGMKFYYKVHKDSNIDTMPLRPLQSCIGSSTHHLSQVLTDILKPLLTTDYIPTYIQDSNQLLYRLSNLGKLEEDNTLISSDVAALYPSIPHEQGLMSVKLFLGVVFSRSRRL